VNRLPSEVVRGIDAATQIVEESYEATKKVRNEHLNDVFRRYLAGPGSPDIALALRLFNAALKAKELLNFDDFLRAETTPLRYVKDPTTGQSVPVMGPLGSDIINPWLSAVGIVDGKPLAEQPMYQLATNALEEHLDFALIGLRDPSLSIDLLPDKLRGNAREAYRRLNPTNEFDGGFDHPLFYVVTREAAKKLFREDFPKAKLTMADVVLPITKGGFGIESCLLCHEQSHTGIYKRLLGQGLYHRRKANSTTIDDAERAAAEHASKVFLSAAQTVLESFSDKIDAAAVSRALAGASPDDIERLKPGFHAFRATLKTLGCMKCHDADAKLPRESDPRAFGVFVLHDSDYYKTTDINALVQITDFAEPNKSLLLRKLNGELTHKGNSTVKLTAAQLSDLEKSLRHWIAPAR
jgi:hypothetical protein